MKYVLIAFLALSTSIFAQESGDWATLLQQREQAYARLREIQKVFRTAPPADQQKLAAEFEQVARSMRDEVMPALAKQLPTALEANPDDAAVLEVAEELMRFYYGRNQYAAAKEVSDVLLKHDADHKLAMNLGGVSRFALHEFTEAAAMFDKAQEANLLMPELGGRYAEDAEAYIDFWKQEQAIRAKEEAATGDEQLPRVKFVTDRGEIEIELFENEAPNAVANFISLVEKKYYDGLAFHRVINGFMAQGGCPNTRAGAQGQPGTGGPGYNIQCECVQPNARLHFAGTLSMAHAGRDTGGSQFFITHLPTSHLNKQHTAFGRVISGMDVVAALQKDDRIQSVTVTRKRNHEYEPVTIPE